MCMINEMNARIKDLEQQVREKDIALSAFQARSDADLESLKEFVAKEIISKIAVDMTPHTADIVHAARCQLINELADRWDSDDLVTIEQVIDLLSAEKETTNAA